MAINPVDLLQKAVKKLPMMKFIYGVLGLAATIAIIGGLKINSTEIPVITLFLVFGFAILIFIFSTLVTSKSFATKIAGYILMFSTLTIAIASAILLFCAIFYDYPKPILEILNLRKNEPLAVPDASATRNSDSNAIYKTSPKTESKVQLPKPEVKDNATIEGNNTTPDTITIDKKDKTFTPSPSPYKNKCFRVNLLAGGCIAFRNRPLNQEETKLVNAECVTTNNCQVRSYPNMNKKACLRKKLLDEATIIRFISNYERVILLGDINEPYLRIKDINGIEGYISSQFYDAVTIRECNDDRTAQNKKYEVR